MRDPCGFPDAAGRGTYRLALLGVALLLLVAGIASAADAAGLTAAGAAPAFKRAAASAQPLPLTTAGVNFDAGDAAWAPGFGWPGVDGTIFAMAVYKGDLIIGGEFTEAGGVKVNRIARWDGVTWHPLGTGLYEGDITLPCFAADMLVMGGDLIVVGSFSSAGGLPTANVARWDGGAWSRLGEGFNKAAQSVAIYGGSLVAGGEFTRSGSNDVSHVARWTGDEWLPLGAGLDNVPFSLVVYQENLVAGGLFHRAGLAEANRVACWNGTDWAPLGAGMSGGLGGMVRCLTVFNGQLIAGGNFTRAGEAQAASVAAWDGSTWSSLGTGMDNYVVSLAVHGGRLVAGGGFTVAGGIPAESMALWDGAAWSALPSKTGRTYVSIIPVVVTKLAVQDGSLIVGGHFDMSPDAMAVGIARWDGAQWFPLGSGLSDTYYISWVSCFAEYQGRLIIGGRLSHSQHGMPSVDIRSWDGSRMDLLEWRISALSTPEVDALLVYKGDLIAAGTFAEAGGQIVYYIARWDGAAWHPLGSGMDGRVRTLAVFNEDLIAGGDFFNAGGVAANRIARWDGSAWHPLGPGLEGIAARLAVFSGALVAAGSSTGNGGIPNSHVYRWNGASWDSLGAGFDGTITALGVHQDHLVAGGSFSRVGGVPTSNIAAWDGMAWSPLGSGTNGPVRSLASVDGHLIAGGSFGLAGGALAGSVAAWDGESWHALGSGVTSSDLMSPAVFALHVFDDRLYIGGHFDHAGAMPSYNIARWDSLESSPPPPPERLTLLPAHPNPFSGSTTIRFAPPAAGPVRLIVHDVSGRRVATLVDEIRAGAVQGVEWDGRDDRGRLLPGGVYFLRLEAGGAVEVGKVVIAR